MRVALFGGSFDPPHRGHVAIARAAADSFRLNSVLFAPAGRQPLKERGAGASYEHRLRMTELACAEDPRFAVSTLDAPRSDGLPNYTVQTLEALRSSQPDAHLFNLAGADSFHTLAHWREPHRLLQLAEWIVVSRPGFELTDPRGMTLTDEQRGRIHLLLHAGDPCADLLSPGVCDYIRRRRLYLAS
jgi:nicotinate-nucleotide adenylyltransferase